MVCLFFIGLNRFGCDVTCTVHNHIHTHSTHMAYIQRLSDVCALILRVDSEIAAADWSVEETRGYCQRLRPRTCNTDMYALSYIISSV